MCSDTTLTPCDCERARAENDARPCGDWGGCGSEPGNLRNSEAVAGGVSGVRGGRSPVWSRVLCPPSRLTTQPASRQLSRCSAPLVVLRERPGSSWRPINDRSGPPRFRNQTIKPYGRPRTRVQRGFTFTLTLHQSRLSARARAHTRTVDHRAVHVRRASLPAWGMGDIGARGM